MPWVVKLTRQICANKNVLEYYGIIPTAKHRTASKAASYQFWLSRDQIPDKKGQKPLPEGKPGCLSGKVFIITGILESLEREEAEQLIKKYGGCVFILNQSHCTGR